MCVLCACINIYVCTMYVWLSTIYVCGSSYMTNNDENQMKCNRDLMTRWISVYIGRGASTNICRYMPTHVYTYIHTYSYISSHNVCVVCVFGALQDCFQLLKFRNSEKKRNRFLFALSSLVLQRLKATGNWGGGEGGEGREEGQSLALLILSRNISFFL